MDPNDEDVISDASQGAAADISYARAEDKPEIAHNIHAPMDLDSEIHDGSDFFGTIHEHEDFDDEIQFNISADDISLDLGSVPDLEDDSDSEDEDEFLWYVYIKAS